VARGVGSHRAIAGTLLKEGVAKQPIIAKPRRIQGIHREDIRWN
jgi:hypothetical protein